MANRYTNLTPAQFNPLSLQEIMMVPMAKQQMHNQQQQMLEEAGIFDISYLPSDEDAVRGEMDTITGDIQSIEDELFETGVSRNLSRRLLDVRRRRRDFLGNEGVGGRAQSAYNAYQQNVKDIMGNSKMDDIDKQNAIRYARSVYANSGGVAQGQDYIPYAGFEHVDVMDRLRGYAKEINPIITKKTGWRRMDDGTWVKGSRKTTKLPAGVIENALADVAFNDPSIVNYLREKQRITPGFNPQDELGRAIRTVSPLFTRDDNEYDESRNFSQVGKGGLGGASIDNFVPINNSSIKKAYDPEGTFGGMSIPILGAGGINFGSLDLKNQDKAALKNHEVITSKLFGGNYDPENPQHQLALREYQTTMGPYAGNANVTMIDPVAMQVGGIAEAVSKDRSKFVEAVNRRFTGIGTKFMVNGEFYNSRKEMLDDLDLDPDEVLEVHDALGIADWDNDLRLNLPPGAEQWEGDFAEPIGFSLIVDGEAVPGFMSRKDKDLGGSRNLLRANRSLNKDVSNMRRTPGLPEKVKIKASDGKEYTVDMTYIPGQGFHWKSGEGDVLWSKEQLEDNRYNLYNVE